MGHMTEMKSERRAKVERPFMVRAAPWLFLLPWIIGMLVITLGPMFASLYLSFTDYNFLRAPKFVGLSNYIRMFANDPRYVTSLLVTSLVVTSPVVTSAAARLA